MLSFCFEFSYFRDMLLSNRLWDFAYMHTFHIYCLFTFGQKCGTREPNNNKKKCPNNFGIFKTEYFTIYIHKNHWRFVWWISVQCTMHTIISQQKASRQTHLKKVYNSAHKISNALCKSLSMFNRYSCCMFYVALFLWGQHMKGYAVERRERAPVYRPVYVSTGNGSHSILAYTIYIHKKMMKLIRLFLLVSRSLV